MVTFLSQVVTTEAAFVAVAVVPRRGGKEKMHGSNTRTAFVGTAATATTPYSVLYDAAATSSEPETSSRPFCYYKVPPPKALVAAAAEKGKTLQPLYKERLDLDKLTVGQKLPHAVVVQELLQAKTGPKLFVDCGVGRYRPRNNAKQRRPDDEDDSPSIVTGWHIQTAMLRLGNRSAKPSVTQKRATRLRTKEPFSVFVSRIRPDCAQLEVCLTREDAMATVANDQTLSSVSSLSVGQTVHGKVLRVEPYGCLVTVDGVNRPGLLHIQQVADCYGFFIDGANGLKTTDRNGPGLSVGASVTLQVKQREGKRLLLDYTDQAKEEQRKKREKRSKKLAADADTVNPKAEMDEIASPSTAAVATVTESSSSSSGPAFSEDELAAWAAYAQEGDSEEEEEEDNDYYYEDEKEDEDRDIEDAMGLGSW